MIDIATVADAIAGARTSCLPGKEFVATVDAIGYLLRPPLICHRRSYPMGRPKKSANVVAIMPPQTKDGIDNVAIDHDLLLRLRPAAAARSTTVPRLIRDLLTAIANDSLTNAVLDDQSQPD